MIAMSGRRALRAEPQHDRRLRSPEEAYHVADQICRLELVQRPVDVSAELNRLDPENARRSPQLVLPDSRELLSRRNGDAGSLPGIPVCCAKEIDSNAF